MFLKRILFFLLIWCISPRNIYAMEDISSYQQGFTDIIKLCSIEYINSTPHIYPLANKGNYNNHWTFHVSQTHAVHPVKSMYTKDFNDDDLIPATTDSNLPTPQFWIQSHGIRVSDDIHNTDDEYQHMFDNEIGSSNYHDNHLFKFDGINQQGISVFCKTNFLDKNTIFYILNRIAAKGKHKYQDNNLYSGTGTMQKGGLITCITLEKNQNRIIYSLGKIHHHHQQGFSDGDMELYIEDIITDQSGKYSITKLCSANPRFCERNLKMF